MPNYYEILGLTTNANAVEIKTAFRNLAKLYHPDKNPNGKEHFSILLKAYETLIHPELKLKYDYKLNYEQTLKTSGASSPYKKYQNSDEQELKRRRYYEEHIKKYEKKKTQVVSEPELKENYNEFKYILYATPIAVILFLLIVNLASNDRTHTPLNDTQNDAPMQVTGSNEMKQAINEFKSFGEDKFDYQSDAKVMVENKSGNEAHICVFNEKKEFIRHVSLKPLAAYELLNLPKNKLLLAYCIKKTSEKSREKDSELFFKCLEFKPADSINPLTLLLPITKGFIKISRDEFFKLSN